jgi:hypothetical protein
MMTSITLQATVGAAIIILMFFTVILPAEKQSFEKSIDFTIPAAEEAYLIQYRTSRLSDRPSEALKLRDSAVTKERSDAINLLVSIAVPSVVASLALIAVVAWWKRLDMKRLAADTVVCVASVATVYVLFAYFVLEVSPVVERNGFIRAFHAAKV